MGQQTIYPGGSVEATVPIGEKIAISNYGGGIAQIYYLVDPAAFPPAWVLQQTLENDSVELGTFSIIQPVRIDANNSMVRYDVAVTPDIGVGDSSTLGGLTADQFLRSDTSDTMNGKLTITGYDILIDNNQSFRCKDTVGGQYKIISLDSSNIAQIGSGSFPTNINSNGTLQYNGTTLVSGTIDTTATQTITVVDGLITSIV